MITAGRVVMKIAGRDAGKLGVVLSVDKGAALVEGECRRRRVSLRHLEPLHKEIALSAKPSHAEIVKALEIKERPKAKKEKKAEKGPRPVKVKMKKAILLEKGSMEKKV